MVKDELSYEADARYVKIGQGITGWTKLADRKDPTNPNTFPTNAYHEIQIDNNNGN